jgi:hypothetical protein
MLGRVRAAIVVTVKGKGKGKAIPLRGLDRPIGLQEADAHDSQHMKVVSLSVLRIGRLYPPGNIPGAPLSVTFCAPEPCLLSLGTSPLSVCGTYPLHLTAVRTN